MTSDEGGFRESRRRGHLLVPIWLWTLTWTGYAFGQAAPVAAPAPAPESPPARPPPPPARPAPVASPAGPAASAATPDVPPVTRVAVGCRVACGATCEKAQVWINGELAASTHRDEQDLAYGGADGQRCPGGGLPRNLHAVLDFAPSDPARVAHIDMTLPGYDDLHESVRLSGQVEVTLTRHPNLRVTMRGDDAAGTVYARAGDGSGDSCTIDAKRDRHSCDLYVPRPLGDSVAKAHVTVVGTLSADTEVDVKEGQRLQMEFNAPARPFDFWTDAGMVVIVGGGFASGYNLAQKGDAASLWGGLGLGVVALGATYLWVHLATGRHGSYTPSVYAYPGEGQPAPQPMQPVPLDVVAKGSHPSSNVKVSLSPVGLGLRW